ncbi:MAG: DUF937 domain-containing protein [Lachnospiraceae bacterium]|nr:DUF937 domain-containing protein [Lachnospiraceae bacterium]
MNLLSLLLSAMTSDSSVSSLSGKTGLSKDKTALLIKIALPILLRALTKNAQSSEGALSLLGALTQHTSKDLMSVQLENADQADGQAILGHILGNDAQNIFGQISQQAGISQNDVSNTLSLLAPALLSGLSAANTESGSGADLSSLTDMFGAVAPSAPSAGGLLNLLTGGSSGAASPLGLLGSLFGKPEKEEDTSAFDGSALLNLLMSAAK